MIVGGYVLHVYCVNKMHSMDEFYGQSKREAYRLARQAGWVFFRGEVKCKKCAKGDKHG